MPTTSPSIVTSGPPELPGLAAASNWIRLVSVCCAFGRAELALQARDDAGRADGPMPNGKPTAITSSPGAGRRCERIVAACRSSGMRLRAQHREVVLGLGADDRRLGLVAVGEGDLDALGAGDDVQVGQDGAVVDDDDAGADAALDAAASSLGLSLPSSPSVIRPTTRTTDGTHRVVGARRTPRAAASSSSEWRTRRRSASCVSGGLARSVGLSRQNDSRQATTASGQRRRSWRSRTRRAAPGDAAGAPAGGRGGRRGCARPCCAALRCERL